MNAEQLRGTLSRQEAALWQLQEACLQLTLDWENEVLVLAVGSHFATIRNVLSDLDVEPLLSRIDQLAQQLAGGRVEKAVADSTLEFAEALLEVVLENETTELNSLVAREPGHSNATQAAEVASPVTQDEEIDPADLQVFCAESREHLQSIESDLITMERTGDAGAIAEIFRAVHSIKGGSQYVGLKSLATLSHRMENLLDRLRASASAPTSSDMAALLRGVDALAALLVCAEHNRPADIDMVSLLAELEMAIAGKTLAGPPDARPDPVPAQPDSGQAVAVESAIAFDAPHARDDSLDDLELLGDRSDRELFADEFCGAMNSARALLDSFEGLVNDPDERTILTRNLHSMKGLAGLVGAQQLELLAGTLEGMLLSVFQHRGEVPHDVRRAVDASMQMVENLFRDFIGDEVDCGDVMEQVELLKSLREREWKVMQWDDAGEDASADPASGSQHPLLQIFSELSTIVEDAQPETWQRLLTEFEQAAALHGYEELADETARIRLDSRSLDPATLDARVRRLEALFPSDLSAVLLVARSEGGTARGAAPTTGLGVQGVPQAVTQTSMPGESVSGSEMTSVSESLPDSPLQSSPPANGDGGLAARTEDLAALKQTIASDDHDFELVGIYLETTRASVLSVLESLDAGRLHEARLRLADLCAAAGYMGYAPLVDRFNRAGESLDEDCENLEAVRTALDDLPAALTNLESIIPGLCVEAQPAADAKQPDAEADELSRIFAQSAEQHLRELSDRLPGLLGEGGGDIALVRQPLASLSAAAANIGKPSVAGLAESLCEAIEMPPAAGANQLQPEQSLSILAMLCELYEGCGVEVPENLELAIDSAEPPGTREPEPHATSPQDNRDQEDLDLIDGLDQAFEDLLAPDLPAAEAQDSSQTPPASASAEEPPAESSPRADDLTPSAPADAAPPAGGAPPSSGGSGDSTGGSGGGEFGDRPLIDAQATIRVDTNKIDDLMRMVAELVVHRSSFMALSSSMKDLMTSLSESSEVRKADVRDLRGFLNRYEEATTDLGRVSNQLQEGVMRIRMMPVKTLFSRVPRLVRDLARREDKDVSVSFEGEDTELDKTVIERLSDPIVHLVRNAIYHGIEGGSVRRELNKPGGGNLRISARHEGNIVILDIEDDGRGIDTERIRSKLVSSGRFSSAEAARLSKRELLATIFLPGFSTAESVNDVSGRGVGLDVVKRNIENLGGQVEVFSEPGTYCRFSLRIPLTMAIMQALLVRVDFAVFAIPVAEVIQAVKFKVDDISFVDNQEVVVVRDMVTPVVRMSDVFFYGYQNETTQTLEGSSDTEISSGEPEEISLVVIQGEDRQIGIVVDSLLGSQDIVIKSLEDELVDAHGIAGASILGDGSVTLILDISAIERMATDPDHYVRRNEADTMRRLEQYLDEVQGLSPIERSVN